MSQPRNHHHNSTERTATMVHATNTPRPDPELDRAMRVLAGVLFSANDRHELPVREVEQECAEFDIPTELLARAKKHMGIKSQKAKGVSDGPWLWQLPADHVKAQERIRDSRPKSPAEMIAESPIVQFRRSTTPCWECDTPIVNPQDDATSDESRADVRHAYCDACKAKRRDAEAQGLERLLKLTKSELQRITGLGFTPGDPMALELRTKIRGIEARLDALDAERSNATQATKVGV